MMIVDEWYDEMIDEIFCRTEQSIGAQIHPQGTNKDPDQEKEADGGDG